ncbi:MAG: TIGR03619 family F420-dependent LLM class oxidoreductase [Pseudomonadales bacterium]
MRFAYHPSMCDPTFYIPLAKQVENSGWDALSFPDSICYPKEASSQYPYNADGSRDFLDEVPFLEPFSAIPALAAVTERISFSTSVVKLPIRNPVLVAKQISTIAVMNNNRFVFGVGLSPWQEDFDICGERWAKRGKRMDEMIEIMRRLLAGGYFGGWDSEFYQIPDCKLCPVPTKAVPILTSGHSEAALKRAARIGDGWISAGSSLEELKLMIGRINELREEYGTADRAFQIHAMTEAAYSADGVEQLEELGVHECIIAFRNAYEGKPDEETLEQKLATIQWFADEVIAKT